ncbi:MAG: hypothetical protein PHP42_05090 [Bacteroidota bacterium]|nr:hypothetical protein [Bacteroidota bacterium]
MLINEKPQRDKAKPTILILYALPNGNSIEMTFGRRMKRNLDWHYDVQHIGAQTRFLRSVLPDKNIIVAYLETNERSWPAWRKKHDNGNSEIARIVNMLRYETGDPNSVVLSAHSGGGSFVSGFLNEFDTIPSYVARIAYLDANYSYDDSLDHGKKLLQWLKADSSHHLEVIAYDDREIMVNGKKIIGPTGGTYRATQKMIQRFREETDFNERQDSTIQRYTAFHGHAEFIIHTNPDTLILHTVLVEKNGFIHFILQGTPYEEKNYIFFGKRVYSKFITDSL